MKNIRIKSLKLKDWKAQNMSVEFSDDNMIAGRNRSGKTTMLDAFLWLLTGYDSEDRCNYLLFDTRKELTYENAVPASVSGLLEIDGTEYRLERIARQGWTRKRGNSAYEKKSSDDYMFLIDDVEVSSKDYGDFIESNIAPIRFLKYILNTSYYRTRTWQELRKDIGDIIGEIQENEYSGNFSDINSLIERYGGLDSAKDFLNSHIRILRSSVGCQGSKGSIEIEIETLQTSLPRASDNTEVQSRIESVKKSISEVDALIANESASMKPILERKNTILRKISDVKGELLQAEVDYRSAMTEDIHNINERIQTARAEVLLKRQHYDNAEKEKSTALTRISVLEKDIEHYKKKREELLEQNRKVKSRKFEDTLKCPFCGQELPDDMYEEMRQTFLNKQDEDHNTIVKEGIENNRKIETARNEISELEEKIRQMENMLPPDNSSVDALEQEKAEMIRLKKPFNETDTYKQLSEKISTLEASIPNIEYPDLSQLKNEKDRLLTELNRLSEQMGIIAVRQQQEERIEEKKRQLRATANELAQYEGMLAQMKEKERQKAEIIRSRVKGLFNWCDIEMESTKKDGTMQPACNITLDRVPSQGTNYASKILIGIDISDAFCRHVGISAPLFIDNAESIDSDADTNPMGRQRVMLVRMDCDLDVRL